ncbi:hypothetical protein GCM10009624_05410 [Gordonia sinesedis]
MRRAVFASRVRAVLCIGLLVGIGATGTLAKWNDSAAATSGAIATGSIDIRAGGATEYAFDDLGMSDMRAGNSRAANLTISNRGSLPLRYTVSAVGAGALAQHLRVTVYAGSGATNADSVGRCGGGDQLGTAAVTDGSEVSVVPARGPVAGTDGSDPLCVIAALDSTPPPGADATLTLTFSASSVTT